MKVVLLEPIRKLGKVGDVVEVKPGYGRNFLISHKKALRATAENMISFESRKSEIELKHNESRAVAATLAAAIDGKILNIIKQCSDDGRLFGSVTSKEIAKELSEKYNEVSYLHVILHHPIKAIGIYNVEIAPYSDVKAVIIVNVARSETEAQAALKDYNNAKNASNNKEEDDEFVGLLSDENQSEKFDNN